MQTITLAEIAKKKKVDTKTARRRLRKAYESNKKLPQPTSDTRWEFSKKAEAMIGKVIATEQYISD